MLLFSKGLGFTVFFTLIITVTCSKYDFETVDIQSATEVSDSNVPNQFTAPDDLEDEALTYKNATKDTSRQSRHAVFKMDYGAEGEENVYVYFIPTTGNDLYVAVHVRNNKVVKDAYNILS